MADSKFEAGLPLLRDRYGSPQPAGPLFRWKTLVQVVAFSVRRPDKHSDWIEDGPLRTARETSKTQPAGLAEFLKTCGRSPRLAGALRALARWWLKDEGRDAETAEAWKRSAETLRGELRALPGVSLALADRILLFVGGLPAFPIDRTALRIVGRHGWIDLSAEYDEWQAFFARGAKAAGDTLAELHYWLGQIGREHCGVEARCEQCPLQPLLPSTGPLPMSDQEGE